MPAFSDLSAENQARWNATQQSMIAMRRVIRDLHYTIGESRQTIAEAKRILETVQEPPRRPVAGERRATR